MALFSFGEKPVGTKVLLVLHGTLRKVDNSLSSQVKGDSAFPVFFQFQSQSKLFVLLFLLFLLVVIN